MRNMRFLDNRRILHSLLGTRAIYNVSIIALQVAGRQ